MGGRLQERRLRCYFGRRGGLNRLWSFFSEILVEDVWGSYPATAKPRFSCLIMFDVSIVPAIPPLPSLW